MKKHYIILTILLFISIPSITLKAEDNPEKQKKKVTLQAKGGLNFSNYLAHTNNRNYRGSTKVRFNIGAIVDCQLKNEFYFQTGLMVSTKGSKLEGVDMGNGSYADETFNPIYLQIPLYFFYKMDLPRNKDYKINIGLGPYFAYGVGGHCSYFQGGREIASHGAFGELMQLNRTDIGLGMEIQLETPKLVFAFGSEAGITKVFKREYLNEDISIRNNVLYLSAGYKF